MNTSHQKPKDLPFKFDLAGAADAKVVTAWVDIKSAQEKITPLLDIEQWIEEGNELILWQLLSLVVQWERQPHKLYGSVGNDNVEYKRLVFKMVQRASELAREEKVLWSPLLDLACQIGWWQEQEIPEAPAIDELMNRVGDWIEAQQSEARLKELFKYRSSQMKKVLVKRSRALDTRTLLELADTPEIAAVLKENPHLDMPVEEALLWHHYEKWKDETTNWNNLHLNWRDAGKDSYRTIEQIVLEKRSLPESLRTEMIADLKNNPPRPQDLQEILLEDADLPEAVLRDLASQRTGNLILGVLKHPNCPEDLFETFLKQEPYIVTKYLSESVLSKEKIEKIFETAKMSSEIGEGLARQPLAGEEIWLFLIDHFSGYDKSLMYMNLAENPEARKNERVRAHLMKSQSKEVLLSLLTAKVPEDFEKLIGKLLKINRDDAVSYLSRHGVPEGARVPQKLAKSLLSSGDRRERLLAVTLFGQTGHEKKLNNGTAQVQ